MAKVNMSQKLNVTADTVWSLIGGFNALPDWLPAVEKSELKDEGQERVLSLAGGGTVVERLVSRDDGERVYSYTILDSPLPVANYNATLRVRDQEDGTCTVDWSTEFDPAGAPEADAVKVMEGVFQAGLDSLKKIYGG